MTTATGIACPAARAHGPADPRTTAVDRGNAPVPRLAYKQSLDLCKVEGFAREASIDPLPVERQGKPALRLVARRYDAARSSSHPIAA
jgi:hypothetical protein